MKVGNYQAGFKKGSSTADNIYKVLQKIKDARIKRS